MCEIRRDVLVLDNPDQEAADQESFSGTKTFREELIKFFVSERFDHKRFSATAASYAAVASGSVTIDSIREACKLIAVIGAYYSASDFGRVRADELLDCIVRFVVLVSDRQRLSVMDCFVVLAARSLMPKGGK